MGCWHGTSQCHVLLGIQLVVEGYRQHFLTETRKIVRDAATMVQFM